MGFNVFLFLVVQLGLEPWKRRRLVGSFEDKVKSALESDKESRALATQEVPLDNEDKERLDRLEQLAAAEAQALQVLSNALLTPAVAPVSPEVPSELNPSQLTWRTFPERLLRSMDSPSSAAFVRPQEIAGMASLGAVMGLLVGSLITVFVRG